ncbi:MAG: phosphonate ABC transporter, permease protein PhnE, partial [Pseudomonadota bacterium]
MTDQAAPAPSIREDYLALTRAKRTYSAVLLVLFFALFIGGFMVADDRNAGGFWNGLNQVFDFPADVLSEAVEKAHELPGHLLRFFPALIETINIAGAATLFGAIIAVFLSFVSTRGLAKYPALIPVFRRTKDILRAIPEIVIALILIFVMGGGPVPAMIAIALHTVGALGKL